MHFAIGQQVDPDPPERSASIDKTLFARGISPACRCSAAPLACGVIIATQAVHFLLLNHRYEGLRIVIDLDRFEKDRFPLKNN